MLMRTVLATGVARLGDQLPPPIQPTQPPATAMTAPKVQIPAKAKPAKKRVPEDYSTPYKPQAVADTAPELAQIASQPPTAADPALVGLSITNDPIPANRSEQIYKYHPLFEQMSIGQSMRVPTANVGKVVAAMRKWIELGAKVAHVKSVPSYCQDTGFGRVWLLAGRSLMPKRQKKAA